jgi:threonine dehydrogenase-like Zn-dependent dehydrogenase
VTDVNNTRLNLAAQIMPQAQFVNVKKENPQPIIFEMTHGRGADFVLESGATQAALDQAFDLVRPCGTVVTVGTFNDPVSFNPFFRMTRREVKLVSTMGRTWETWRRMVQLIESNKINLKPYLSYILPLEEYRYGFSLVKAGEGMKVLLKP